MAVETLTEANAQRAMRMVERRPIAALRPFVDRFLIVEFPARNYSA
jgi:hypothetical protein